MKLMKSIITPSLLLQPHSTLHQDSQSVSPRRVAVTSLRTRLSDLLFVPYLKGQAQQGGPGIWQSLVNIYDWIRQFCTSLIKEGRVPSTHSYRDFSSQSFAPLILGQWWGRTPWWYGCGERGCSFSRRRGERDREWDREEGRDHLWPSTVACSFLICSI